MTTQEEQLTSLAKRYDQFFEMSDDHRAYQKGLKDHNAIKKLAKEIGSGARRIWLSARPDVRPPFD